MRSQLRPPSPLVSVRGTEATQIRAIPRVAERILLIVYGLYATGAVLGPDDTASSVIALAEETVRAQMRSAATG